VQIERRHRSATQRNQWTGTIRPPERAGCAPNSHGDRDSSLAEADWPAARGPARGGEVQVLRRPALREAAAARRRLPSLRRVLLRRAGVIRRRCRRLHLRYVLTLDHSG
jgi:hypothetical protein